MFGPYSDALVKIIEPTYYLCSVSCQIMWYLILFFIFFQRSSLSCFAKQWQKKLTNSLWITHQFGITCKKKLRVSITLKRPPYKRASSSQTVYLRCLFAPYQLYFYYPLCQDGGWILSTYRVPFSRRFALLDLLIVLLLLFRTRLIRLQLGWCAFGYHYRCSTQAEVLFFSVQWCSDG